MYLSSGIVFIFRFMLKAQMWNRSARLARSPSFTEGWPHRCLSLPRLSSPLRNREVMLLPLTESASESLDKNVILVSSK